MALANVHTLEEYADYLERHADEAQALHQECLITITSFFRDPVTFEVLSREVLPRLLKDRPPGAPVRVWVPGCATGEQMYSITICLLEAPTEQGTSLSPGLRQRPFRERRGESAVGPLPPADRPGRLAGKVAAVLPGGGRRLTG